MPELCAYVPSPYYAYGAGSFRFTRIKHMMVHWRNSDNYLCCDAPQRGLRNLLLLTAPFDFANIGVGTFSIWLEKCYVNVNTLVAHYGCYSRRND